MFFANDFSLTDPSVNIKGKDKVLNYISGIFNDARNMKFDKKNIIVSKESLCVIEFNLEFNNKKLVGTDVIHWNQSGLMKKMDAYLYEKND